MAKVFKLVDDLTGEEISDEQGGTITFALRGEFYEIDLSNKSYQKLQNFLAPYIEKARKVPGPSVPRPPATRSAGRPRQAAAADREQIQAMRDWLRAQGHTVSDRGRIAANLQELYHQANP